MARPAAPLYAPRSTEAVERAPVTSTLDLDELFRQHAGMVAAIGFRILGRSQEIEDLVQDVFMDACRDAEKIRQPEAIKGWLAICAIRRARRRLRVRRLKRALGFEQEVDYETVAAPDASPARRALLRRLYQVLDEIPVEQRLAWSLRYLEGEDLESVARLCGCSLATAKRRISAAASTIQGRLA
jgi:RNA polymerase sigma-70 factor (ECF subfamily)